MRLVTKRSQNNWIEWIDGVKLLIGYPSLSQEQKLEAIRNEGLNMADIQKQIEANNFDMPYQTFLNMCRYLIKCTIKGWKGIEDNCELVVVGKSVNGEDITELSDELAWALTKREDAAVELYNLINSEIMMSETDKKKLHGSDNLPEKGN